jgi:hypothetical protein
VAAVAPPLYAINIGTPANMASGQKLTGGWTKTGVDLSIFSAATTITEIVKLCSEN